MYLFKILCILVVLGTIVVDAIWDGIKGERNHVLGVIVAFIPIFAVLFFGYYLVPEDVHYYNSIATCVFWVILRFSLFDIVYAFTKMEMGHDLIVFSETSGSLQDQFWTWLWKKTTLEKNDFQAIIFIAKCILGVTSLYLMGQILI